MSIRLNLEKQTFVPPAAPESGFFSSCFQKISAVLDSWSTPESIHEATCQGRTYAVLKAIECDPKVVNAVSLLSGETPLMGAVRNGDLVTAELLIRHGADLNAFNRLGNTALHLAVDGKHPKLIQLLLQKGADPFLDNNAILTPLDMAVKTGLVEEAKVLLDGQSVKQTQIDDYLLTAVTKGHPKMAKLLLENWANPNVCSEKGNPLLHIAAKSGDFEIAKILLDEGADRGLLNASGQTVAYYMRRNPENYKNPQALKAFPLSDYDREYHATKIMSHVFSCKGEVDFKLDGSHSHFMHQFLGKALKSYDGDAVPEGVKKSFYDAYNPKITDKARAKKIRAGELVFIPAGWKKHAVELVFFKGYVAIVNRGKRPKGTSTLEVFKIDSRQVTEKTLEKIKNQRKKEFQSGAAFFYESLPKKLNGKKKVQDEFCRAFHAIAPKSQKSGNCSFASPEGALRVGIAVALIQGSCRSSLKLEEKKELLQEAKKWHKAFNQHVTTYAYETYGPVAADEFYEDETRNTRVALKLQKANYTFKS